MAKLAIYLLGAPIVELDGKKIEIPRRKALALLAYLVATGVDHTREALATFFWPDYDASRGYANLRRTLYALRKAIGDDVINAGGETIGLVDGAQIWLDSAAFQEMVRQGRDAGDDQKIEALEEAAALYRGSFMEGFTLPDSPAFDEWGWFQAEALQKELAWALETLTGSYQSEGAWEKALASARNWLALDDLNERPHRLLMVLYAQTDQRSAALRQYEICRRRLEEELGVPPSPETTALMERIKAGELPAVGPGKLPATEVDITTRDSDKDEQRPIIYNLPIPATPFVGRGEELAQISDRLHDDGIRLLTLLGPGGSGKTRLALESAANIHKENGALFPDGAAFVPLAPVDTAEGIITATATALNFRFNESDREPRQQLMDFLDQKRLLLVADNIEHLLSDGGAEILGSILAAAPESKVMVTSRERVNLAAENVFIVSGMRTPDLNEVEQWLDIDAEMRAYSAVGLFVQSAGRIQADFELNQNTLPAVVKICQLTGGMPLAIELAAGWLAVLTPQEIVSELEGSLDILASTLRDLPERQRSIQAVFTGSWQRLTPAEQKAFLRLSVFRGGFRREEGEAAAGVSLPTLLGLTNKSFLQREAGGRFYIHELLRRFASERLAEDPDERRASKERHARVYANFLAAREPLLKSKHQMAAMEEITADFDNIRAAWRWWAVQKDGQRLAEKMLPALYLYCENKWVREELLPLLTLALAELPREQSFHRAILETVWIAFSSFSSLPGWYHPEGEETLKRIWPLVKQEHNKMGDCYPLFLEHYIFNVDREKGLKYLEQYIDGLDRSEAPWIWATTRRLQVELRYWFGKDHRLNLGWLEESLTIFRRLGDRLQMANTLLEMGEYTSHAGEHERAMAYLLEAQQLFAGQGDRLHQAVSYYFMAQIWLRRGRPEEAFANFKEQQQISRRFGLYQSLYEGLHWESVYAQRYSTIEHALTTRQQTMALAKRIQYQSDTLAWNHYEFAEIYRLAGDRKLSEQHLDQAQDLFGSLQDQNGLAACRRVLGYLALSDGDFALAETHFQVFIDLRGRVPDWHFAYSLTGRGRALMGLGQLERSREDLLEAMEVANNPGNADLPLWPIAVLARLEAVEGHPLEAVRLAALVESHPLSWIEMRDYAREVMAEVRPDLDLDEFQAAEAEGQAIDLQELLAAYKALRKKKPGKTNTGSQLMS